MASEGIQHQVKRDEEPMSTSWRDLEADAKDDLTELDDQRNRRLEAVISVALVSLMGFLFIATAFDQFMASAQIGLALLVTLAARLLQRAGKYTAAKQVLVWSIFVAATLQLWNFSGVNAAVLLTYPCLLAAGVLLLPPNHLKVLVAAQLLMTALVGLKNVLLPNQIAIDALNYGTTTLYALVGLAVTSAVTILAARELSRSDKSRRKQGAAVVEIATRLAHNLAHDQHTNLPNRVVAKVLASEAIHTAKQSRQLIGVMFIDLDNMHSVAEEFGIDEADNHLLNMSSRIASAVLDHGIAIKHCGDCFVVVTHGTREAGSIAQIAENIRTSVSAATTIAGRSVIQTCSTGIAIYPDDGESYEALLNMALIACRAAQNAGRNTFHFHNTEVNKRLVDNSRIVGDMKFAIERNELSIFYVPIIDLKSNTIVGAEASLRWQHPTEGLLKPTRFLKMAEENGDMVAFATWAVNRVFCQIQEWQKSSMQSIKVSFALSVRHFSAAVVETGINSAMANHPIPPGVLQVILPQTCLSGDTTDLQQIVELCRAKQIPVAIDNFGSGSTNLRLLQSLNFSGVRLDHEIIRDMTTVAETMAIVKASIQAAGALKIAAYATGVDNAATLEAVRSMGFATAQGRVFGTPMPLEEFEMLVHQNLNAPEMKLVEEVREKPTKAAQRVKVRIS